MLGLVVTPTMLCSSTSDCRLPLRMRSRERSSSQTATPALDSWARFSFWVMSCPSFRGGGSIALAVAGRVVQPAAGHVRTRRGHGGRGGGLQALPGGGGDGVAGEPELLVQRRVGGAGAVVVQADDPAGVADEVAPAHRHPGLDADPGADGG